MAARFRAIVVIAVRHPDGRLLAFERVGHPNSWQLPQGGIEVGEDPVDAAWRELAEETGLGSAEVELTGVDPRWIAYEVPTELADRPAERVIGSVARWVVFTAKDPGITPRPDGVELGRWCWMGPEELIAAVVGFKAEMYRQVLA